MAWQLQEKRYIDPKDVAAALTQQGQLDVAYLAYNTEDATPAFELQHPVTLDTQGVVEWLSTMTPGDVWITPRGVVTLH